ncbi:unnamed protein product [Ostreobium quekettii]|uniref:Uncharacterized protein n=1 Tax=Ostreobium quekettii TaxID=121088 RepID=A0A8S1JHA9_9CHLO|nr:unnamed protein product [Ostreobium quekettii]|eukprot:evm.model.scf_362EXC.5 EVM.evm.TU.scf_362EXC.5   scf_362EXC:41216-44779(+)
MDHQAEGTHDNTLELVEEDMERCEELLRQDSFRLQAPGCTANLGDAEGCTYEKDSKFPIADGSQEGRRQMIQKLILQRRSQQEHTGTSEDGRDGAMQPSRRERVQQLLNERRAQMQSYEGQVPSSYLASGPGNDCFSPRSSSSLASGSGVTSDYPSADGANEGAPDEQPLTSGTPQRHPIFNLTEGEGYEDISPRGGQNAAKCGHQSPHNQGNGATPLEIDSSIWIQDTSAISSCDDLQSSHPSDTAAATVSAAKKSLGINEGYRISSTRGEGQRRAKSAGQTPRGTSPKYDCTNGGDRKHGDPAQGAQYAGPFFLSFMDKCANRHSREAVQQRVEAESSQDLTFKPKVYSKRHTSTMAYPRSREERIRQLAQPRTIQWEKYAKVHQAMHAEHCKFLIRA